MGKHKNPKNLWLYVSNDKYELPVYICDTAKELAQKRGVSEGTVRRSVFNYERHGWGNYRKVRVEEDGESNKMQS